MAELKKSGFIEFKHCKTDVQRADLFTKVLEKLKFLAGVKMVGMQVGESGKAALWKAFTAYCAPSRRRDDRWKLVNRARFEWTRSQFGSVDG